MSSAISPAFAAAGPGGLSIANNQVVTINGVAWTANNWNQAPHPTAYSLLMASTTLARFQAINGQNDPDFDGANVIRSLLVNGAGFPFFTPIAFSATINWALNTPYPTVNVFNVLMQLHGGIEGSGRSPCFSINILPNGAGEKMDFNWNYQTPSGPFTFSTLGSIPFSRNTNYAIQITYVDGHGYNLGSVVVVVNGVTVVNFSGVTGHALAVTNSNPSFGYYGGVVSGVPVTQNNVASINNPSFSIGTTPTIPFSWLDGTLGAPVVGTGPQYPTLLNGYVKVPNWNVAGVAYPVGIPDSSFPLKNPLTSVPAGCSVAGTTLTVNAIDVYLDGYDFSVSGGVNIVCAQNRLSIINCLFDGGATYRALTNGVINFSGIDLTIRYCKISGGFTSSGTAAAPLGLIYCANGNRGALSFQYNWFLNCAHTVLRLGSATPLNCQYNLFDNINVGSGGGSAYVTWNSGGVEILYLLWQFNTSRQVSTGLGATVGTTFFDANAANQEFFSLICQYNTAVAPGATVGQTMSYIFEGNPTSAKIGSLSILGSNYADYRGALGMFYPNTWVATPQLTITPNYNMVTGAVVDPNAPTAVGFYIAPASATPPGNDSNPGTSAAPFLTPTRANTAMNADRTKPNAYFKAGTHTVSAWAFSAGNSWLADPADPPFSATINTTAAQLGLPFGPNTPNITIKGLKFTSSVPGELFNFSDCAGLKIQGNKCTSVGAQNFLQIYRPGNGLRIQGNTIVSDTWSASAPGGLFPINIIFDSNNAVNDWIINSNDITGGTFPIQVQYQGTGPGVWTNVHCDWNIGRQWGDAASTVVGSIGISWVGSYNAANNNNTCTGNQMTAKAGVSSTGGIGIEALTSGCTYAQNVINAGNGCALANCKGSLFNGNTLTVTGIPFGNDGTGINPDVYTAATAVTVEIRTNIINGVSRNGAWTPTNLSPLPSATSVPTYAPSAPYVG